MKFQNSIDLMDALRASLRAVQKEWKKEEAESKKEPEKVAK
ncbi:hypothetical protein [Anoxybacter fermentans]|nr:hypothetical protein [Anoxybacter fermentans]